MCGTPIQPALLAPKASPDVEIPVPAGARAARRAAPLPQPCGRPRAYLARDGPSLLALRRPTVSPLPRPHGVVARQENGARPRHALVLASGVADRVRREERGDSLVNRVALAVGLAAAAVVIAKPPRHFAAASECVRWWSSLSLTARQARALGVIQLERAVVGYISWYRRRLHESLDYLPPLENEQQHARAPCESRLGSKSLGPTTSNRRFLHRCAIVCAIVRNACKRRSPQNLACKSGPRTSPPIRQSRCVCRDFFERSGAGVEPTQPGAARPHRF
jgi:hypothetical protein